MSLEIGMFALGLFLGGITGTAIHLWNLRRLASKQQRLWDELFEKMDEKHKAVRLNTERHWSLGNHD